MYLKQYWQKVLIHAKKMKMQGNYCIKIFLCTMFGIKEWKNGYHRKKVMLLARINGANPIEGERYYLRLLLNNVKGPTSFNGLWTMHGKRYCKCKEASQIRGLLESNGSLVDCLKETELLEMSYALRRLFATLLIFFKLGNYGIFFFFFFLK